jgi:hypothetical protein
LDESTAADVHPVSGLSSRLTHLGLALPRPRAVLFVIAATALLMSVALIDGWPTVFYDSGGYYLLGEDVAQTLHLTKKALALYPDTPPDVTPPGQAKDDWGLDRFALGSRSSIYGFLMYACDRIANLWLLIVAQACAAAWILYLLWRKVAPAAPGWSYLAWVAALSAGSSLAFFVAFVMPDVFAGVAGLSVILLMVWGDRLSAAEKAGAWATLVFSLACHTSNPAIVFLLLPVAALVLWRQGVEPVRIGRNTALVAMAVVAAVAANFTFLAGVKLRTGGALHAMPFLAGRLLADGPGRRYLYQACDHGADYALCRFRTAPLDNADDIFWSFDPQHGVMSVTDDQTKLAIVRQQPRFVMGVIAAYPLDVARAELGNFITQLTMFESGYDPISSPDFFLTDSYWKTTNFRKLLPGAEHCRPTGPGCVSPFQAQLEWLKALQGVVLATAVCLLGWQVVRPLGRASLAGRIDWRADSARTVSASLILVAFVFVNGFVSGVLSAPYPRYESRLIWVVPALAGLLPIAWFGQRRVRASRRATAAMDRMRLGSAKKCDRLFP